MMTQSELKKLFHYDPVTGVFTHLRKHGHKDMFDVAGYKISIGYIQIRLHGRTAQYAHRLAFLYMTGNIPEQVDHKNQVRDDNRWRNLRKSSYAINNKNVSMQKRNTSGYVGVNYHKETKKWQATIGVNGKLVGLGYFDKKEDAVSARKEAEEKHDFHANHGKNKTTY